MLVAEHITVSMDVRIGQLIDGSFIDRIDIDFDQLQQTLQEVGEFNNSDHTPLHIRIGASKKIEHPVEGVATASLHPETRKVTSREINVPLFNVAQIAENAQMVDLDSWNVNSVLCHELQHAADYDNPVVTAEQEEYMIVSAKEAKRKFRYQRTLENAVAITGLYLIVKGMMHADTLDMTLGAISEIGYIGMSNVTSTAIESQFFDTMSSRDNPLEARAYCFQDELESEDRVPAVVKVISTENWHS
jgi:hypothetical protein